MEVAEPGPRRLVVTEAEMRVVAAFLHDGCDYPTVAARCGVTYETVKSHMKAVIGRAGLCTRVELAVAVLTGRVLLEVRRTRRLRVLDGEPWRTP